MAFATGVHQTCIPLPSGSGDNLDHQALLSMVPVHIVTHESQLPKEFLHPSAEKQFIIGFDCEGVDLSRYGKLCIMQFAFPDAVYLIDAIQGGTNLMRACKPALESTYITKVIHDCKRDSEALYFQYGIKLHNVVDTQLAAFYGFTRSGSLGDIGLPISTSFSHPWKLLKLVHLLIAYYLIEEQEGQRKRLDDSISFVSLLADHRYCGISYVEKKEVRTLLREDPNFWTYRPMSELMIRAAADDVRFLRYIYHKMMEMLSEQSLWKLAARGVLYCRSFCINDKQFADWPSVPSIPDSLMKEDYTPEQEILSVLDVPPGKMGCIIGRKGASILAIKESCRAEIVIGGSKGPPDKVIIIGPVKQVRKAEAMLRGRFLGN